MSTRLRIEERPQPCCDRDRYEFLSVYDNLDKSSCHADRPIRRRARSFHGGRADIFVCTFADRHLTSDWVIGRSIRIPDRLCCLFSLARFWRIHFGFLRYACR